MLNFNEMCFTKTSNKIIQRRKLENLKTFLVTTMG